MSAASIRIQDIIRRIDDNITQSEAIKTCFGILAIMSREESNKQQIAKDGMETILNGMTTHVDKCDVQESGCDLLWSLAFNNAQVKENIAKYGGSIVLVRALKRYNKSAEFLKSACGALSNICQFRLNQEGVAVQGGLQPLVGAIHSHQANGKLLPFIFDAIASLIVTNEENAKAVSTLGLIPLIISSLNKHKNITEVVKSGCHALAILSDVKGQASKVAFAGGVPVILNLLDMHPAYPDLHRVAAVVMLRMLQESIHVAREITCHEGVRILLKSLDKGGAQLDTVAAVTHILFTVTNPSSPASASIEPQLWLSSSVSRTIQNSNSTAVGVGSGGSGNVQNVDRKGGGVGGNGLQDIIATISSKNALSIGGGGGGMMGIGPGEQSLGAGLGQIVIAGQPPSNADTALVGLVNVIGLYVERKDVVRAGCRLLNNLLGFPGVVQALEKLNILDRIFDCVHHHRESKDVIDFAAALLKAIQRRAVPFINATKPTILLGLLFIFGSKMNDEEAVIASGELLLKYFQSTTLTNADNKKVQVEEIKLPNGKAWEVDILSIINSLFSKLRMSGAQAHTDDDSSSISSLTSYKKALSWTKNTQRLLLAVLSLLENIIGFKKPMTEDLLDESYKQLKFLNDNLSPKMTDIAKKIEKLIGLLATILKIEIVKRDTAVPEGNVTPIRNSTSPANVFPGSPSVIKVDSKSSAAKLASFDSISNNSNNNNNNNISSNSNSNSNSNKAYKANGPRHPLKFVEKFDASKPLTPRLLDCWPNYLERLSVLPDQYRSTTNPLSNLTGLNIPERMHIVYDSPSAGGRGLQSRVTTPTPYVVPPEGVGPLFDHSLTFDSEFESGNLMTAIQRGDATYDLFLRADLHTVGQTQWFYFAVSNTHPTPIVRLFEQGVQVPPVRVRFNIINLQKPDSLFNMGMRPVVYSCTDASTKEIGWVRSGSDICYYSNSFSYGDGINSYYSLSFTIEFHNPKDTVLIAYTYPYTIYDHKYYMNQILSRLGSQDIIRNFRLCTSLSGEDCDLYVVTNFKDKERVGPLHAMIEDPATMNKRGKDTKNLKPAFFLSGRVHPGEPPASWMMKGILDFITSNSPQAQLLRQTFVIFVVPILNPDGVIYGNNRCCLAGVDLNRQWKVPMKTLHPTVFSLKNLMIAQKKIRDIYMYIDLHGHSRKYNVFMYGCDDKKKPRPQVRDFPRFLSNHLIGRKYISFDDCSFHIKKGRESTARVVVAKELNIPYSYTLEATFCGSNYGPLKHCHMNIGHLQEVGASLCDSILNYAITEGYIKDIVLRSIAPMNAIMAGASGDASAIEDTSSSKDDKQYAKSVRAENNGSSSSGKSNKQQKDLDSDSDNSDIDDGAGIATTSKKTGGGGGSSSSSSNSNSNSNRLMLSHPNRDMSDDGTVATNAATVAGNRAARAKSSDELMDSQSPNSMPRLQVRRSSSSSGGGGGGSIFLSGNSDSHQGSSATSGNCQLTSSSPSGDRGSKSQSSSQLPQPPSGVVSQSNAIIVSKNFRTVSSTQFNNSNNNAQSVSNNGGGRSSPTIPSEYLDDMAISSSTSTLAGQEKLFQMAEKPSSSRSSVDLDSKGLPGQMIRGSSNRKLFERSDSERNSADDSHQQQLQQQHHQSNSNSNESMPQVSDKGYSAKSKSEAVSLLPLIQQKI